jgi:hypothetical protein
LFSQALSRKTLSIAVLFSLSLLFFLERGAYRALHDSRTGDFVTVYAAARCWLHHENPYEPADLTRELVRSGTPPSAIDEQDRHASLYLIPFMPLVAVLAWLPWTAANVAWCLLSLGCFAASIVALLQDVPLSGAGKWIAASICLFFSPTYVGVLNGNPSVLSISITILSLHFAIRKRLWLSGLLFAAALCAKPQIALCIFLALLLWRCWRPLFIGSGVAALVSMVAVLQASSFGQHWNWWASLRQNLANETAPGGLVDPRPSSPHASGFLNAQALSYQLSGNPRIAEGLVLLSILGLIAVYFYSRKRHRLADKWVDAAFFAAVTLAVTYHRYYDGQLLLVAVPAVVCLWQSGRVRTASVLSACFLLIAFPLQLVLARVFQPTATHLSLKQIILFRHDPIAILVIAVVLSFPGAVVRDRRIAAGSIDEHA